MPLQVRTAGDKRLQHFRCSSCQLTGEAIPIRRGMLFIACNVSGTLQCILESRKRTEELNGQLLRNMELLNEHAHVSSPSLHVSYFRTQRKVRLDVAISRVSPKRR